MLPMCEAIILQNKPGKAQESEDEDMACGDLGNGLVRRHGDVCELEGFSLHESWPRKGSTRKSASPYMLPNKGEYDASVFRCTRCNSLIDMPIKKFGMSGFASCSRQNSFESSSEASNEELKQHLQEVVEEVEILRVELEASQRQLEGKEQALKILQSMAVLDKATSHTKAALKKNEQQKRALEKEINALQWEIKINQEKFKNIEEAWAEKYDSIYCENAALKETLKLKTDEIKTLKSEKELLDQQRLEILAMLDVKQQKIIQENMSLSKNGITEITGLELAVLGACTCSGPNGEPCSCAKMSAATRKQLLQLKQEFELLKKSKEEAYIMADAFRIAFEQQLMRRKDQALRLAQMSKIAGEATTDKRNDARFPPLQLMASRLSQSVDKLGGGANSRARLYNKKAKYSWKLKLSLHVRPPPFLEPTKTLTQEAPARNLSSCERLNKQEAETSIATAQAQTRPSQALVAARRRRERRRMRTKNWRRRRRDPSVERQGGWRKSAVEVSALRAAVRES